MIARVKTAWERFWFEPIATGALAGPRVVASLTGLWLVLSRGAWRTVQGWPEPLISAIPPSRLLRYLLLPLPPALEIGLYLTLLTGLLFVASGKYIRLWAPIAAVLLYRIAAVETIFENVGPFRQGLTQIVLVLLVFTATGSNARERCGLNLIRFIVAGRYLAAGLSKLHAAGLAWTTATNVTGIAAIMSTWEETPLGTWIVLRPGMAASLGLFILLVELTFISSVMSRRAAHVAVPAALCVHLLQFLFFGMIELALPLLLVFLPWEGHQGTRDGD